MELWEPYAKQNIVTLYTEQPSDTHSLSLLPSNSIGERLSNLVRQTTEMTKRHLPKHTFLWILVMTFTFIYEQLLVNFFW